MGCPSGFCSERLAVVVQRPVGLPFGRLLGVAQRVVRKGQPEGVDVSARCSSIGLGRLMVFQLLPCEKDDDIMVGGHVGIRPVTFLRLNREPRVFKQQLHFISKVIVRREPVGIIGHELPILEPEHPHLTRGLLIKWVDRYQPIEQFVFAILLRECVNVLRPRFGQVRACTLLL